MEEESKEEDIWRRKSKWRTVKRNMNEIGKRRGRKNKKIIGREGIGGRKR